MSSSVLSSGKRAVGDFLYASLLPAVTAPACRPAINASRLFTDYLVSRGAPRRIAEEYTERWRLNLMARLERRLEDWEGLGLPRPLTATGEGDTLVTWRHPRYEEISGRRALAPGFGEAHEWIAGHRHRRFLTVGVAWLRLVGANPIFITDTSGDRGVDLIGRIADGPLRSACLFVQAKGGSSSLVTRDEVLCEYGKFCSLGGTSELAEYRRALGLEQSLDGAGVTYAIVANCEFNPGARRIAHELGVLLRSRTQLAYWVSGQWRRREFDMIDQQVGTEPKANLSRNLAG